MSPRGSPTLGYEERTRRERVLQQVLVKMGREDLTYAQAGAALDIGPEILRKTIGGQTTPSVLLIEKAEKWIAP